MKKLREAVLSKGVSAEKVDQTIEKKILSDEVLDTLDNVGGSRPPLFGRVFGRIPF